MLRTRTQPGVSSGRRERVLFPRRATSLPNLERRDRCTLSLLSIFPERESEDVSLLAIPHRLTASRRGSATRKCLSNHLRHDPSRWIPLLAPRSRVCSADISTRLLYDNMVCPEVLLRILMTASLSLGSTSLSRFALVSIYRYDMGNA